MPEMWSYGAGQNSTAGVIRMVQEGWRGLIVFADPGAEDPETYCYLNTFDRWLAKYDLSITRISPLTHPDLYLPSYRLPLIEKCRKKQIVPLMLNRWCTVEYKRTPLTRLARREGVTTKYIGIAADEKHRLRSSHQDGMAVEYPLADWWGWGREECKEAIARAGLPVPPKSGCFLCPFQSLNGWRRLYELRPDLFNLALELDNVAIEKMKETRTNPFEGQLTYKHGTTLQNIKDMWDAQLDLPLMPEREYEYLMMCECMGG